MKTKEELNALKEEVDTLNKKLAELSEDELKQVAGGGLNDWINTFISCPQCGGAGAYAIRDFYHDCYYDVYCEHCGFYAAKL